MLWLALGLTILGFALTLSAAKRGRRPAWIAGAGTVVAALAVLGAASIGIYLLPAAALLLVWAAVEMQRSRLRHLTTR
jgi:hypothetical protein